MNYLITAAGLGTRFLKKGIKPPKPLIKVNGIELLLWSLNSFEFVNDDKLYLVTLKEDRVKERLIKKLENLYPNINIYWHELKISPNGQLLTALTALNIFKLNGPLVIHNCDTSYKINNFSFNSLLDKPIFGAIPYFISDGNNWSFLKILNNKIIEVTEKQRISDNCSVGTYFFKNCELFLNLSNEYIKKHNTNLLNEFYIAPLYNYAIKKGLDVLPLKCDNIQIFGTCHELLNNFEISFFELLAENDFNGHQRKTLVFDIDGTICKSPNCSDYSSCEIIEKVCERIRYENSIGTYIILYTSRNMRSFKGNIGLINKYTSKILSSWLEKNKIPYDELYFGKPWGKELSYIDDKSLPINSFLSKNN
tara:strand:- start:4096 stop:5190 length:1095 start_codon:yes stop_codon:yes gene_type:complete